MEEAQENEKIVCAKKGCGEPGRWTPRVLLYPQGVPDYPDPVEMQFTDMAFCDEHCFECTTQTLLSDSSWEKLIETFAEADSLLPDRETMELKFTCLDAPPQVH